MCHKSESIVNLAVALVKFNAEVTKIEKDASNPFFKSKYAPLDAIIDHVRPILANHGLAILQLPGGDGENVIIKTMLIHESGEWLESDPLIMKPVKNDPQAMGSAVTYARRYSLAAVLSLSIGDEDDDGNKATHTLAPTSNYQPRASEPTQPTQTYSTNQSGQSGEGPTDGQRKMLYAKHNVSLLKGSFDRISDHLGYPISKFDEVKKSDVNKLIALLDENKAS